MIYDCSHVQPSSEPRTVTPSGFCVYSGARKSVFGQNQLKNTLQYIGRSSIPRMHSNNTCCFDDVTVRTVGTAEIMLATPPMVLDIPVLMDIILVDVPALLGLDILDSVELYADNVTNRLFHRHIVSSHNSTLQYVNKFHVPLSLHGNHLYSAMSFSNFLFYTTTQLEKMYRQFAHPQPEIYSTSSRELVRRQLTRKNSNASATSS